MIEGAVSFDVELVEQGVGGFGAARHRESFEPFAKRTFAHPAHSVAIEKNKNLPALYPSRRQSLPQLSPNVAGIADGARRRRPGHARRARARARARRGGSRAGLRLRRRTG